MIDRPCRFRNVRRRLRPRGSLNRLCIALLLGAVAACTAPTPRPEQHPAAPGISSHATVAVLGATGMVGKHLVREGLARGYTVRALARTPAKLQEFGDQIDIIQGDALDPAVIARLLDGSEVVISAIGPVKSDGAAAVSVSTEVTRNVIANLERRADPKTSRYAVVSGAAVVLPGDQRDLMGWWIRQLAQIGLRSALQDKQNEYQLLAESTINWTLFRCPVIEDEAFQGEPLVSLVTPPSFGVRAGELAHLIFDALETGDYVGQGPFPGSQ